MTNVVDRLLNLGHERMFDFTKNILNNAFYFTIKFILSHDATNLFFVATIQIITTNKITNNLLTDLLEHTFAKMHLLEHRLLALIHAKLSIETLRFQLL